MTDRPDRDQEQRAVAEPAQPEPRSPQSAPHDGAHRHGSPDLPRRASDGSPQLLVRRSPVRAYYRSVSCARPRSREVGENGPVTESDGQRRRARRRRRGRSPRGAEADSAPTPAPAAEPAPTAPTTTAAPTDAAPPAASPAGRSEERSRPPDPGEQTAAASRRRCEPTREGPARAGSARPDRRRSVPGGLSRAMRARDVNRPTEEDIAEAERDLVIVRRHWRPRG